MADHNDPNAQDDNAFSDSLLLLDLELWLWLGKFEKNSRLLRM